MSMRVSDGATNMFQQYDRGAEGKFRPAQIIAKMSARDEARGEVKLTVVFTGSVNRQDIRVIEPGDGLGFHMKPQSRGPCGRASGEDHFQSHRPGETDLPRFVNHAHAATADLPPQFIVSKETAERATFDRRFFV